MSDALENTSLGQNGIRNAPLSLRQWNDLVEESFHGCVVDTNIDAIDAEIWSGDIESIRLNWVRSQPSKVLRWVSEAPSKSSGTVLLHLLSSGYCVNQQLGRSASIKPGECVLCDADRYYSVDFKTPYEVFVVELPVSAILNRVPEFDLDHFAGEKIDVHRSQLLLAFLKSAWMQRDILTKDAELRDCVSRTSTDLALRAICQVYSEGNSASSVKLQRLVLDYIHQNIDDPNLKTSTISRMLSVSPRSVQSVFERLGTTTSAYILQQRLQHAAQQLIYNRGKQTITELAFDCGFSDSSYFSRCFRRHFGVSPRKYRL